MEIEMVLIECASCHIPFAITKDYKERLKKSHAMFWCPQGHQQHYPGKTDEEKLRDELNKMKMIKEEEIAELKVQLKKAERKPRKKVKSD